VENGIVRLEIGCLEISESTSGKVAEGTCMGENKADDTDFEWEAVQAQEMVS
jgi:hypothetical protein